MHATGDVGFPLPNSNPAAASLPQDTGKRLPQDDARGKLNTKKVRLFPSSEEALNDKLAKLETLVTQIEGLDPLQLFSPAGLQLQNRKLELELECVRVQHHIEQAAQRQLIESQLKQVAAPPPVDYSKELEAEKEKIRQLSEQLKNEKDLLGVVKALRDKDQEILKKLQTDLDQSQNEAKAAKDANAEKEKRISSLQGTLAEAAAKFDKERGEKEKLTGRVKHLEIENVSLQEALRTQETEHKKQLDKTQSLVPKAGLRVRKDSEPTPEELTKKNKELQQQLTEKTSQCEKLGKQIEAMKSELEGLQTRIGKASSEIVSYKSQIASLTAEKGKLEQEVKAMQNTLSKQLELVANFGKLFDNG